MNSSDIFSDWLDDCALFQEEPDQESFGAIGAGTFLLFNFAAAVSGFCLLVREVKADRREAQARLHAFALKHDIPDIEGFKSFSVRAMDMNSEDRMELLEDLMHDYESASERRRRAIESKMNILLAFQAMERPPKPDKNRGILV